MDRRSSNAGRSTPAGRAPRPRLAVSILFFVNGAVLAAWAANIPAMQAPLDLQPGRLGLVLLAVPIGAALGMLLAGWLAPALGSGRVAAGSASPSCIRDAPPAGAGP